jgi:hypothetical protein
MDTKLQPDEIPITALIIFIFGIFSAAIFIIFKILKYIFKKFRKILKK